MTGEAGCFPLASGIAPKARRTLLNGNPVQVATMAEVNRTVAQ
ncbi:MAG TPA: hypothetical protein VGH38_21205 [Bryobacteraceae bacterium]|jgi:hypothetical protein